MLSEPSSDHFGFPFCHLFPRDLDDQGKTGYF